MRTPQSSGIPISNARDQETAQDKRRWRTWSPEVPWSNLVEPAAVAATIAELVLGGLLVAGLWWRWTGKASAGLFFLYLVTMVPGMGAGSVLEYGVPVLIGGCLLTSARGLNPRRKRKQDVSKTELAQASG